MLIPKSSADYVQHLNANECHQQFSALLNATDVVLIGHTPDNLITYWSPGAVQLYGYPASYALGKPLSILLPPDRRACADEVHVDLAIAERVAKCESVHVTRDRTCVNVELTRIQVIDDSGHATGAWTLVRDITGQMQAELMLQRIQQNTDIMASVSDSANRVVTAILADRFSVGTLRHIAEDARSLAKARYAVLSVAGPDGHTMLEFVTPTMEEAAQIGPGTVERGKFGPWLDETDRAQADTCPRRPAFSGLLANPSTARSFLNVPICSGETVLGSICLTDKEGGGAFTNVQKSAVEALARYAALAVHILQLGTRQRALIRGLIIGREEERREIAFDLHDGLTQYVMASHAHLQTAQQMHEQGDHDREAREMSLGMDRLEHAVVESRRLVNELGTLTLDDTGLAGAIGQLIQDERASAGWNKTEFVQNLDGERFDVALETTVYRVIQESLNNARKHAQTNHIRVTLVSEELVTGQELLRLGVQDWGIGFVPADKLRDARTVGLHSMAERVRIIGGSFTLESLPQNGTIVHALFPAKKPT